jgi:hypothetical protein
MHENKHAAVTVRGAYNLTSYDEEELIAAIAHYGPVALAY